MGNCIDFSNFLELCCQCKVWNRIFIASGSQVGTWTLRVHPWRLCRLNPWWWERDVWEIDVWTLRRHVDIPLNNCRTVPIIIFYDIGLLRGNMFGQSRMHFVKYNGRCGHWPLLWRVYSLMQIICNLGKYIWELLNCHHLGVANVRKWRLGFWGFQGMG